MEKFQMLKAGDYILYAVEASGATVRAVENQTGDLSLCYGEQGFIILESYLAYNGVNPAHISYYTGQTIKENRIKLLYSTLTYSEIEKLEQIFGRDNIFIESDCNYPSMITVVCNPRLA